MKPTTFTRLLHKADGTLVTEWYARYGDADPVLISRCRLRRCEAGERYDLQTLPGPDWDEPTDWKYTESEYLNVQALRELRTATREVQAAKDGSDQD